MVAPSAVALTVAGLTAANLAAGQAPPSPLDQLPRCAHRSDWTLLAPRRLPHNYEAGIAVVDREEPGSTNVPGSLRVAVEPLPGGRLRHPYTSPPADKGSMGAKHFLVFPLRFGRGDTGARVTVAYQEEEAAGKCLHRVVRDVPAEPAHGVRARVTATRITQRWVTVEGRISRRGGRRPAYIIVVAYTTPPGFSRLWRLRVRGRGGHFRGRVRSGLEPGEHVDYKRAWAWFPGDFSDPAPVLKYRF